MPRKLASIQRILSIAPIPNADNLEVATVLGWHCVVLKGQFKAGDLVVYIECDAVLPNKPEFEFMRARHFKVKTIKLRGQISQGLVMPLSILPFWSGKPSDYQEDADVTESLEITKYEPELPKNLTGNKKSPYRYKYSWLPDWFYKLSRKLLPSRFFKDHLCIVSGLSFPDWLVKTDETRVQLLQGLLDKYQGTHCYSTEKLDGSSITCYLKDDEFGVCSRNVDLKEEVGNTFWDTVRAMDIEAKMRKYIPKWRNIALQGELIGEGIQGNKLKLKGQTIRFFNVFDIDNQEYMNYQDFIESVEQLGLETVPVLFTDFVLGNNIDDLVILAQAKSVLCPSAEREGIVIRPLKETEELEVARGKLVRNRVSFKAINPKFLLKYAA
jgi:hypothetical protein